MKLKKIVSLALAGVMAVGMLTACGSNGNGGQKPPEEDDNTVAGGYSAVFAKYVADKVKDMDYVTFQDNADDVADLEDALGNAATLPLVAGSVVPMTPLSLEDVVASDTGAEDTLSNFAGVQAIIDDFVKNVGERDKDLEEADLSLAGGRETQNMNNPVRDSAIYVVDGKVDVEKAVKHVAEHLSGILDDLPENGTADKVSWNYNYTISVSVVNKTVSEFLGSTFSANFIAVTVTRNPVK